MVFREGIGLTVRFCVIVDSQKGEKFRNYQTPRVSVGCDSLNVGGFLGF